MMEYRSIGKTGLRVSPVGLGCMGMSHAYGEAISKEEAERLLLAAIDLGYTLFDTAEVYGTPDNPHHNEELLGEILAGRRDKVVLATKFGITFGQAHTLVPDSSPAVIRQAVEGSLRRLRTDHIDLYYQHRIDPRVEPETVAEVMQSLINEGKILHWGISEATEEYLRRAHKVCPVAAVQNRYSMMARWHEALFPTLEELGVGLVAFSPMANGLLTNRYSAGDSFDKQSDYRASMPQYSQESFEQNKMLMNYITALAEAHNATPAQISMAWMLCRKPWIVPIPGTRKVSRLKENIGAANIRLSAEKVAEIDKQLDALSMSQVFGGSKVEKE